MNDFAIENSMLKYVACNSREAGHIKDSCEMEKWKNGKYALQYGNMAICAVPILGELIH